MPEPHINNLKISLKRAGLLALFFCLFSSPAFAANSKPAVGAVTPSSGSSNPYQQISFSTTYTDPNGWQDTQDAYFLINNALNGANCFYVYYKRSTNQLFLRDSAYTAWLGGFAPQSANIIENSQAKLYCAQSAVSGSGNTLSINWSLALKSTFAGAKNTYLYVKDTAGADAGPTNKGTWNINPNSAPVVGSISPSSGTFNPNLPVNFIAAYADPNTWEDIQYVYFIIIDPSIAGSKYFFYSYYDQNTNKLYLRNDANTAWLGGYAPGSNYLIENSYSKLDCSKTTVSGIGNTLTLNYALIFKPAFLGSKNIYLYVKDDAGAYQGWVNKGAITIKAGNKPPLITSTLPADNSIFLAGAIITIKANASDPENDPLQYQFSIGGTVKQAWSSSNTYIWQTSSADTGAVSITTEVKDSNSNLTLKTISIRMINPTIQEVLKKVVDNYAKISDFSADMALSSTLDAKPFGTTDYCRYYFKAPNKEKTETFNDAARQVKNDIIIISGSNMHLIDPIKNIKQSVDLLADAGISSTEFSQLDLYYNQALFLSKNTVSKNNFNTDFNNMIIALDATPNEKNNIYDKLGILIDYNKGLIVKIVHYKNDELPQMMEVIETKQMPNGAWVTSKLKKIPNLKAGNLIVILSYDNIQINTGLTDSDFDPDKQF